MSQVTQATKELPVATVVPSHAGESPTTLSREQMIHLLSTDGAILFRGFDLNPEAFESLSGVLGQEFIRYVWGGRRVISDEAKIQSVGTSYFSTRLHGELSDTPLRPHVLWFGCQSEPSRVGETLICDSAHIAEELDDSVLSDFRDKHLRYRMTIPPEQWRPMFDVDGGDELQDKLAEMGCGAHYRLEGDALHQDFQTPLFSESYFSRRTVCVNAMVTHSVKPPWHHWLRQTAKALGVPPRLQPLFAPFGWVGSRTLDYPTLADGSPVPGSFLRQISRIAERHAYAHRWQTGDVILLDNTRFLHGRRRLKGTGRKILTRFGYVRDLPEPAHH